jgi:hypothetical protein
MRYLAFFTNAGTPATGLAATIRIRRLDTSALVVTDAAMAEVGDGLYQYDHVGYDDALDYGVRMDGSAALPAADRYSPAAVFSEQPRRVREIWQLKGLDATKPLVVDSQTPNGTRKVPADASLVNQTVVVAGTVTTVTRL